MLILLVLILLAGPASAAVPEPGEGHPPVPPVSVAPTLVPPPPPAPAPAAPSGIVDGLLGQITAGISDGIEQWWQARIRAARERSARHVEETLRNAEALLGTPDVRNQERVQSVESASRFVAAGILTVLLAWGLTMIAAGERLLAVKELLPRLFIAAAGVVLGGTVMSSATGLSNGLLGGFLQGDAGVLSATASRIIVAEAVGWALLPAIYMMLAYVLLAAAVLRVALLVVLAASGPLAQVTWALPQLDSWARTWWRMLAALLLVPVGQAFLLRVAMWTFFSGGGEFGLTGLGVDVVVLLVLMALMVIFPVVGLKIALGPLLAGAGRIARAARKGAALAGVA